MAPLDGVTAAIRQDIDAQKEWAAKWETYPDDSLHWTGYESRATLDITTTDHSGVRPEGVTGYIYTSEETPTTLYGRLTDWFLHLRRP